MFGIIEELFKNFKNLRNLLQLQRFFDKAKCENKYKEPAAGKANYQHSGEDNKIVL